ncbi:putative tricarboxylic transport membrane protein [Nocardioides sp. YR527]|uniref:tripartite tricarboxylate transporter TctB family protein n=1 Tax=Nocardioides sp. YR527 TaxID=1881028 RepID=UPI00087ED6D0|nr:tripartite tricarboxylate transporter TctB family protein [Nocardioides sp. YR527]SDJ71292.1 putative tricarboxylic transport membrane protein [Nocardioides sp. YR527]
MSVHETETQPPEPTSTVRRVDFGQYGLALFLVVVGIYTVIDASGLDVGFADPVGPRAFPYVIGAGLVVVGVLLAVATARGSQPEPEEGEDVDLSQSADWLTVLKLVAVLLFTVATVNLLGWAISGAALFAGAAWCLGSRTLVRDVIVGLVLSVASWYAFYVGLGIPLTPGVLDGIL